MTYLLSRGRDYLEIISESDTSFQECRQILQNEPNAVVVSKRKIFLYTQDKDRIRYLLHSQLTLDTELIPLTNIDWQSLESYLPVDRLWPVRWDNKLEYFSRSGWKSVPDSWYPPKEIAERLHNLLKGGEKTSPCYLGKIAVVITSFICLYCVYRGLA